MPSFMFIALCLLAATLCTAHPRHNVRDEAAERAGSYKSLKARNLGHCEDKLITRGHTSTAISRRASAVGALRRQNARLAGRDFATVLNTTHHSNLTGITANTDAEILFTGERSCTLVPESTQGPYFVSGEMVRSDITEDEPGVPLYLDIQLISTRDCEPIEGVALDIWHANATGEYSGYPAPEGGMNTTFLRGIQVTDDDGVVAYKTIFPGHYNGRATHIHMAAHSPGNWTLLPNNTIAGGKWTSHVGQVFYDQDVINQVETFYPYTENNITLTTNDQDIIIEQETTEAEVDPIAEYVLLGESVAEGIYSWISIAIDPEAIYWVPAAVDHVEGGGVEDPCFEMLNLPTDFSWPDTRPAYCSTVPYAKRTAMPTPNSAPTPN
ncbi:hypothetical protein PFICI_03581 [Pestalotiopsis fici W106-1]|uniref:Intradiol ring-cleavage dioxygenases domain-containing protein n=1 Tax=Pestalotiopsis fici (strain W106-1 / CGMCC3.15140) TaxID=1229662 RepID=W3XJY0_PESFW|nr:uncharacterized protein PFICI_03581 [Pestalotiopsis fici W106-1]ETS85556.1 hypothetical protein PFICI_03581 [Pestalotiopsis fici W106-1]